MNRQGSDPTTAPGIAELMGGNELDQLIERRTYWLLTGITFTALIAFGISWGLKGGWLAGGLCILNASLIGMSMLRVATKTEASVRTHLHAVILTIYGFLGLGAWLQGTLQAPALKWLSVLPFIALASGYLKLGGLLVGAFVAQSVVMAAYVPAYVADLRPFMLPSPNTQMLGATIGSVLIFAIFGCFTLHWRRNAQGILDRARIQARQGEQAKERFLATMSHEIRTPLNGIVGVSSMLGKVPPGSAQHAQLLNALEMSANNLVHMLNDVLDWTKLGHGGIALSEAPLSIRDLVSECAVLHGASGQSKGVVLTHEVDAAVPDRIMADGMRLKQVLNNLLSNAVKFTERGDVRVRVAVTRPHTTEGMASAAFIEIAVQDSGIGIPPDRITELFQPFQQLDQSISRRFGGTGLGLSIAQAIMQAMQGRIEVHSSEGQGSRFTVCLPLREAPASPVPEALPADQAEQCGMRVLIVEDNEINQWLMAEMLQATSSSACFASSGTEALAMLAHESFDLLLLDYHLPGLDGVQTLARIREHEKATGRARMPAAMISGDLLQKQDPRLTEFDAVLAKPCSFEQVQTLLASLRPPKAADQRSMRGQLPQVA